MKIICDGMEYSVRDFMGLECRDTYGTLVAVGVQDVAKEYWYFTNLDNDLTDCFHVSDLEENNFSIPENIVRWYSSSN